MKAEKDKQHRKNLKAIAIKDKKIKSSILEKHCSSKQNENKINKTVCMLLSSCGN